VTSFGLDNTALSAGLLDDLKLFPLAAVRGPLCKRFERFGLNLSASNGPFFSVSSRPGADTFFSNGGGFGSVGENEGRVGEVSEGLSATLAESKLSFSGSGLMGR
jgi:hypothetical protein